MRNRKPKPQINRFRRFILGIFMLGLLILVTGRIGYIYAEKSDFYAKQGDIRSIKRESIPALRGVIQDRKGEVLALTTVLISLGVDLEHLRVKPDMSATQQDKVRKRIKKFKQNLEFIAGKIGKSERWLMTKVFNTDPRIKFKYLAKKLTPQIAKDLKNQNIPALVYERSFKRFYPQSFVGANLLGFANFKDQGKAGIEAKFDDILSGANGKAWVRRDHFGNAIDYISLERSPVKGQDLNLSIDSRIQEITYFTLAKALQKHKAHKAAAVVLNAKSGEILAIESLPSFNPNNTAQRTSIGTRNAAIQDLYEPGSIIKPFTVLAALEAGVIGKNKMLHIGNGRIKVANATYRDYAKIKSKDISLATMLKKSSNVGAIKVGFTMSPRIHRDFLYRLGFGQEPKIRLNGIVKGVLRQPDKITRVDHASMSFGFGLNASLLHLAKAYLVLANKGSAPELSILKKIEPGSLAHIASRDNTSFVLDLLKTVVSKGGTAPRAAIKGFSVAGKTGTSHKFVNGQYAKNKYIGLFAGIVPVENPELVIVVLIDEPKGKSYYGGATAAPVFAEIGARTLAYLGVRPDMPESNLSVMALNVGGRP